MAQTARPVSKSTLLEYANGWTLCIYDTPGDWGLYPTGWGTRRVKHFQLVCSFGSMDRAVKQLAEPLALASRGAKLARMFGVPTVQGQAECRSGLRDLSETVADPGTLAELRPPAHKIGNDETPRRILHAGKFIDPRQLWRVQAQRREARRQR